MRYKGILIQTFTDMQKMFESRVYPAYSCLGYMVVSF